MTAQPVLESRRIRVAGAIVCMALFAGTAPWVGIGKFDVAGLLGRHPAAIFALLGGLLALPEVVVDLRAREYGLTWVCGFLVASLAPPFFRGDWIAAIRLLAVALTVGSFAALARRGLARPIVRAFVASTLAGCALSLLAYARFVSQPNWPRGLSPFVYYVTHDALGNVPRLAGTAAHSPLHFGETCVAALLLLQSSQADDFPTWRRRGSASVLAACIVLTFSWAWAGLLILLASFLLSRLRNGAARIVGCFGIAAVLLAGACVVEFGVPDALANHRPHHGAPCSEFDAEHFLVFRDGDRCEDLRTSWPYRSRRTLYAEAHITALESFREHPGAGIGPGSFPVAAGRHASKEGRPGSTALAYYESPHSIWLEYASFSGVPGLVALGCAVLAIGGRTLRERRSVWLTFGALGLFSGLSLPCLSMAALVLAQRPVTVGT